jgi:COP9 signalosome complex subunit 5
MTNQRWQDPFLALVVDPNRTVSAGKVDIGAFRTYPEGHTPSGAGTHQSVPLDKIEDFGAHANEYYPLKVSVFKSSLDSQLLDLLWERYWVKTLSSSSLVSVRLCFSSDPIFSSRLLTVQIAVPCEQGRKFTVSQLSDLTAKLGQAEPTLQQSSAHARGGSAPPPKPAASADAKDGSTEFGPVLREEDDSGALTKAVRDGSVLRFRSHL